MNFFEHQEKAKKNSGLLILYFVLAVAMIILTIYVSVSLVLYSPEEPFNSLTQLFIWDPNLFTLISCGILLLIILGSTYKIIALSRGGESIATQLGGVLLNYETTDPDEKKVLNIVEEMSIASGIPVPKIYLLQNQDSINAFAAGNSINDAVIGVTRGSIVLLNRDELQGVIAHEFSHILNGDMNLNLRLIGVLHGILLIGLTGEIILRSMRYGNSSRRRKGGKDGGGGALVLIAITLFAVGYIGVFFGKLIKSAVSRQREFLADASAVQFTRYPDGIAGALKKIGGFSFGSRLTSPKAQEASHMFFSNGLRNSFLSLLATHPPLQERIQRIDPSFKGNYPEVNPSALHSKTQTIKVVSQQLKSDPTSPYAIAMATALVNTTKLTDSIGTINKPQLDFAKGFIKTLPSNVAAVMHDTYGARAIIYALLLSKEMGAREDQITKLAQLAEADVIRRTVNISQAISGIEDQVRLPLAFLTIPALKNLSIQQYEVFKKNINDLIAFDNQQSIFEFCLKRIITQQLDIAIKGVKIKSGETDNLKTLEAPIKSLIWSLAVSGHDTNMAKEAFVHSIKSLDLDTDFEGLKAGVNQLDKDLTALNQASPRLKKQILDACVDCVTKDGKATLEEAELLRTIAISLECPAPPILES